MATQYGFTALDFGHYATQTATLPSGGSATSAIDMNGYIPVRFDVGAGLSGTALSFQVSFDNSTFRDLYSGATNYAPYVSAGLAAAITPSDGMYLQRYVKIRAGISAAPMTQTGAVTITILGVRL